MIEIKAGISKLSFKMVGEPVLFLNQALYFQSKSIIDVVSIPIKTGKIDMILVGILICIFSIVFPAAIILSSILYYFKTNNLMQNRMVEFFTLHSGKWSRADVMVAALFMAYIGFSGLISSQLSHLEEASQQVEVLITIGIDLQVGFFLFLGFCIASLVFSTILKKDADYYRGVELHTLNACR